MNAQAARDRAVQAAMLGYAHRGAIHYTQGGHRWDGIANRRNARAGQYPYYADCSSFVTWCLWNALYLGFGVGDVVNGCGWNAGYTGTLLSHGQPLRYASNALPGDAVIYGNGWPGHHAAIVVRSGGAPMVVSHGGESGPSYLRYDYMGQRVMSIRRYITGPAGPRVLRQGMRGNDVAEVQTYLLRGNYLHKGDATHPPAIDGDFGPATKAAVQRFQRDNHLTVDGIVGPQTLGLLRRKYKR